MSSALESEAVFRERALAVGLTQPQVDVIIAAGLGTLGRLAFGCGYVPGSADDSALRGLMTELYTAPAFVPSLTNGFRRLYFEAYSVACAEVRTRLEPSDSTAVRRLPNAERAARLMRQQGALGGMCLSGVLEPSNSLVDLGISIWEENSPSSEWSSSAAGGVWTIHY